MSLEDLYRLPLDQFIPARTALARQLRQSGASQEAARVSKLRKPSVAAWAVNQLVRTQRRDFAYLLECGENLQRAQTGLLGGGGDAEALRQAVERERAAVRDLVRTARGLLTSEGHELTPQMLERVEATFHAAALDPAAREQVEPGCLERELRHAGLGTLEGQATSVKPGRARTGRGAAPRRAAQPAAAHSRRAQAEARRAVERTNRELSAATDRRDQAAQALTQAEERLAEAREAARRALREQRRIERQQEPD